MHSPLRHLPLALALVITSSCTGAGDPTTPAPDDAQGILLITLDTVRADHLGLYGYGRPTTPRLEAFAERATTYTKARAAAPWTLPSHATLFTGLYPFEHGARTYERDPSKTSNVLGLGQEHVTLAEAFQRNGYRTAAVVANAAYLMEHFSVDQGFEHYDVEYGSAQEVNQRAFAWLDEVQGQPFFLFLNYMDAHGPYRSGPSPNFEDLGEVQPSTEIVRELYAQVTNDEAPLPAQELEHLKEQYDYALANLDLGLGELFAGLRSRGLLEAALIVITSDHGEYFGEHRLIAHSKDVYEGAMHIPLVVKAPQQASASLDEKLISLAHIPGLILEHTQGLQLSSEEHATFMRHWPRSAVLGENYYSRLHDLKGPFGARFERIRRVVYLDRYKYIESSDGAHELYDLSADPEEAQNLFASHPEEARLLAKVLESETRFAGEDADRAQRLEDELMLDDGELERLRALGY